MAHCTEKKGTEKNINMEKSLMLDSSQSGVSSYPKISISTIDKKQQGIQGSHIISWNLNGLHAPAAICPRRTKAARGSDRLSAGDPLNY
mgnify:CR=1 FL=1